MSRHVDLPFSVKHCKIVYNWKAKAVVVIFLVSIIIIVIHYQHQKRSYAKMNCSGKQMTQKRLMRTKYVTQTNHQMLHTFDIIIAFNCYNKGE